MVAVRLAALTSQAIMRVPHPHRQAVAVAYNKKIARAGHADAGQRGYGTCKAMFSHRPNLQSERLFYYSTGVLQSQYISRPSFQQPELMLEPRLTGWTSHAFAFAIASAMVWGWHAR
jgi:hypothetical protein